MTLFFVISFIFLCGFLLVRRWTRRMAGGRPTIAGALIGYLVVLQFVLVEFDFGPTSGRIYWVILLTVCYVIEKLRSRNAIFTSRQARGLFFAGCLYFAAVVTNLWIFDRLTSNSIVQLLSYFVFALCSFLCIQGYLRNTADLMFVLLTFVVIASINGLVATFQWRGDPWAWDLYAQLRPSTWEYRLINQDLGGLGYSPGLQEYSIQLSFILLFCLSSWVWLIRGGINFVSPAFLLLLGAFSLGELGTIAALSRSSLLAYNGLALIYFVRRAFSRGVTGRKLVSAGIVFLLIAAIGWAIASSFGISLSSDDADMTAARITRFDSSGREDVWEVAIELIEEYPLWGSGLSEFSNRIGYSTAPHNMFLNAAVYYGLFGLLAISYLVYRILRMLRALVAAEGISKEVCWSCALPLMGYLFKGLFHNDSLANGGILGWMMIGLCCVALSLSSSSTPIRKI